jgi:arylsulfatase A-like enzyme
MFDKLQFVDLIKDDPRTNTTRGSRFSCVLVDRVWQFIEPVMPINRREFVGAAIVGATLFPSLQLPSRRRPNILFILADDMGWGDLSCYGRPDYQTPNLDRLAAQGTRFVNAYSASPVCTPTRCAFITGRYPARTRVGLEEPLNERRPLGDKALTLGLPAEHPTIASLLKGTGYETALIGKWHLGYLPNFGPIQSGFDEFFGIMSGAADFFTHKDMQGDLDFYEGKVPVERIGYTTDLLTGRAVEYLRRRRSSDRPFYLSLHYTAPHWPWEGPGDQQVSRELGRDYEGFTAGGSLKTYAAMMKSLDDGVGRVLDVLSRTGQSQNTLVIFTSDNGGERYSYNWPFSGKKFDLREGGIRVPAIIRWPGVVPAGQLTHQQAITMDWTATMLAVGNAKPDPSYPLDGIDQIPPLRNSRPNTSRTLFWRTSIQDAAVNGSWKYLRDGNNEYLFNLADDEREQHNFRAQNPERFAELKTAFAQWNATVLPRPPVRVRA